MFDQYSKSSSKGVQNIKFKVYFEIDTAVEAVLSENISTSASKRVKTLDDIMNGDESGNNITMVIKNIDFEL